MSIYTMARKNSYNNNMDSDGNAAGDILARVREFLAGVPGGVVLVAVIAAGVGVLVGRQLQSPADAAASALQSAQSAASG
ncbi:MAG: hypothetical protein WCJ56_04615, partial [bacterium]